MVADLPYARKRTKSATKLVVAKRPPKIGREGADIKLKLFQNERDRVPPRDASLLLVCALIIANYARLGRPPSIQDVQPLVGERCDRTLFLRST